MNIVKAHARTGFYFDYDANSDKRYTVITAGPFTVFNWGRVGGPIGQLDIKKHASPGIAQTAADKKWDDKTGPRARDRYGKAEYLDFDVDLDRITPDKHSATQVIHVYNAAARGTTSQAAAPTTADGTPAPSGQDRLALLTQRALDVIELSVSQPTEALAAFADVNELWAELQDEIEKVKGYVVTAEQLATV